MKYDALLRLGRIRKASMSPVEIRQAIERARRS